eukprot:91073-Amphidinium_carterae.1
MWLVRQSVGSHPTGVDLRLYQVAYHPDLVHCLDYLRIACLTTWPFTWLAGWRLALSPGLLAAPHFVSQNDGTAIQDLVIEVCTKQLPGPSTILSFIKSQGVDSDSIASY